MSIQKTLPTTTLEDAMAQIDQTGMGIIFVANEADRLIGTATDGDIRRGILEGIDLTAPVSEVMNTDPVSVKESWSNEEVREHISRSEVRRKATDREHLPVPVLDENRRIVGSTYVTHTGELVSGPQQTDTNVTTVLVIGGAGYIGSVLCRKLLSRNYRVHVLDTLTYTDEGVQALEHDDRFTLIEGDMRSIDDVMRAIDGVDAVMHLGALVGEPASSLDPQRTLELNYHATKLIANICKYHQINRFVFASTCSTYGQQTDELSDETSELHPVSLYARTKIRSENALLDMATDNFAPTILRMATVYGLSPRMRFDLVVNILSAKAMTEETIPIYGGDQYRPNVHVADAAQAYIDCVEAPLEDVSGEIFNVGSNEQNYKIREIGEIVNNAFPNAEIDHQPDKEDNRTYQVDFSKIRHALGYDVEYTISDACEEIQAALESGEIADYTADRYSNYQQLDDHLERLNSIRS